MNPTNHYQFPQPKYEEGQHVQSDSGEKGVIAAFTYANFHKLRQVILTQLRHPVLANFGR